MIECIIFDCGRSLAKLSDCLACTKSVVVPKEVATISGVFRALASGKRTSEDYKKNSFLLANLSEPDADILHLLGYLIKNKPDLRFVLYTRDTELSSERLAFMTPSGNLPDGVTVTDRSDDIIGILNEYAH